MTKLFVAGATGYTGRALCALAAERGLELVAHVRPGSKAEGIAGALDRTPWERAAMSEALARHAPTHVFALLGTTRHRASAAAAKGEDASYEAIDRDLSLMLLAATEPIGARFVYLSSLGADRPGGNRYLKARFDVEAALRKSATPWIILRPSFITGPDRGEPRPAERIAATGADVMLRGLAALGAKRVAHRYGSMDARTLAEKMLLAALDERTAGSVLDAADLRAL